MNLCQWKRYRKNSSHHVFKSDWQLQYISLCTSQCWITQKINDKYDFQNTYRITAKRNCKDREGYLTMISLQYAILTECTMCKVENVKPNICNKGMF